MYFKKYCVIQLFNLVSISGRFCTNVKALSSFNIKQLTACVHVLLLICCIINQLSIFSKTSRFIIIRKKASDISFCSRVRKEVTFELVMQGYSDSGSYFQVCSVVLLDVSSHHSTTLNVYMLCEFAARSVKATFKEAATRLPYSPRIVISIRKSTHIMENFAIFYGINLIR